MTKISLWDSGRKGKNYKTMDKWISQYFFRGGTAVYVHLYVGPYQQDYEMLDRDGSTIPAYDPNNPPPEPIVGNVTSIQDVLFLENRDRKYSDYVFEIRGVYNVNDLDFDLRQFGLMLQNDTLFIEFHLNDLIDLLGRKLMPGDVLELPHRRDDTLDINAPAINKFYVVEDASRSAGGYAATWWPHIWRVKVSPMTAAQEYQDILNQQQTNPYGWLDPGTVGSLMDTIGVDMGIDQAVVNEAKRNVPARYFETRQYWVVLPETKFDGSDLTVGVPLGDRSSFPWIFAGDGDPPNGAIAITSGRGFPLSPQNGDYCLRTDYHPATLFIWQSGAWRIQEQDWRSNDWSAAHRLLLSFINNYNISTFDDHTTGPERIALSKAVKPKADF